ncbi:MAG: hypothetical protein ACOCP8_09345 [archaeon]
MKQIKTHNYNKKIKQSDSKKEEEQWDVNPWAVCHTTVDKDKDPKKYERCVKKVKKQQEEDDDSKEKEAQAVLTPETEDDYAEEQEKLQEKEKELDIPRGKIRSKKPPKVLPQSKRLKMREDIEKQYPKELVDDDEWQRFLKEKEKERKVQSMLKGKIIKI